MDICPFFQEQVNQYTHFETLLYIHTQTTTYIYRTSEQKCLQFSIEPPHLPGSWAIPVCARTTYGRGSNSYKNQWSPAAQRGCSNLSQLRKVALVRISEWFWVQRKDALFACQTKDLKYPLLGRVRYRAFGNGAARRARGCAAPAVSWAPAPPKAPEQREVWTGLTHPLECLYYAYSAERNHAQHPRSTEATGTEVMPGIGWVRVFWSTPNQCVPWNHSHLMIRSCKYNLGTSVKQK